MNRPQSFIESAVISMKMNYRLKVLQTENLRETISRLSLLTLYIQKEFRRKIDDAETQFIGLPYKIQEFMYENDKKNCQTMGNIFIDMLQRIKSCGNDAVSKII